MIYAHFDKNSKIGQPLLTHMQNVGQQMKENIELLNFNSINKDELEKLLYLTGIYHDIGKAMSSFQNYLRTGKGGDEKNHSLISAVLFSSMFKKNNIYGYLSFLAIAKHHGSIESRISDQGQDFYRLAKQHKDCLAGLDKESLLVDSFQNRSFDFDDLKDFLNTILYITSKRFRSDEYFFGLQYIFSKLIAADKIDSANLSLLSSDNSKGICDVEKYIDEKNGENVLQINDKRTEIKNAVLNTINSFTDEEIKCNRIFTITAPTGTGKTLTSICASLAIKQRIKEIYGYDSRIITALPFINILEQTKTDYENIFGDVLLCYSDNDYKSDENMGNDIALKDKLMLANTWESNVIITTFVQFFESIMTNKNSKLLKLNKLAGSIVILDEIQSLPGKYYPLIGAVIKRVSDYYGTRFILMTATQPEIILYANLLLDRDKMSAIELLENRAKYYEGLSRTKIVSVMDKVTDNESLVELIKETKKSDQSALVVVNTIAQSIKLYNMLKGMCKILYLSTNLIGVDRKNVIAEAKRLLDANEPFIMVSTQTIEAGVDLDFDIGYRDLAPLESIVQVAGRINRSGKKGNFLPLYVFNTSSGNNVYKMYNLNKTKELIKGEIKETEYSRLVHNYYRILLADDNSYDTEIYKAIKTLDYNEICKFQLIDNKDAGSVIIEIDDVIYGLIRDYCSLIKKRVYDFNSKAELKRIMSKIGNYIVDVRVKKLINHKPWRFKDIYDIDLELFIVPRENVEDYYDETGFVAENKNALFY